MSSQAELYIALGVIADLGGMVEAQRIECGLSLRAAAEQIGVSFSTVARIEVGRDFSSESAKAVLRWLMLP